MLAVEPSFGEALKTDFKMSATGGWTDPDGDTLQYQFAYTKDTGADAKYFSYTPQAESSLTSQLPPGNLTLRVRCVDDLGGYSEAFNSVIVTVPTKVNMTSLGNAVTNLVDEQNTGQLVALASSFVSTLTDA